MEKVTLTKVNSYTTDKEGKPLVGKNGKPYTRVLIQTDKHGDQFISGFGNQDNAGWKEGDEVEIEVEEVTKGDKTYYNFKTPRKGEELDRRITGLEISLGKLAHKVNQLEAKIAPKQEDDYPPIIEDPTF